MENLASVVHLEPGARAGHTAARAGNYIVIWGGYDEPVSHDYMMITYHCDNIILWGLSTSVLS